MGARGPLLVVVLLLMALLVPMSRMIRFGGFGCCLGFAAVSLTYTSSIVSARQGARYSK